MQIVVVVVNLDNESNAMREPSRKCCETKNHADTRREIELIKSIPSDSAESREAPRICRQRASIASIKRKRNAGDGDRKQMVE